MNVDIQAVHFDLKDETREYIEKKLEKLDFAEDMLVELGFILTKEKESHYVVETKYHFRWGVTDVIKVKSFDLYEGLNKLIDKFDNKVKKEKKKIQQHQ